MSDTINGEGNKVEIRVPLEKWVQNIALAAGKEAAQEVMKVHVKECPARRYSRIMRGLTVAVMSGVAVYIAIEIVSRLRG